MPRSLAGLAGLAAFVALPLAAPALADVDPDAGMLRYPDISSDHIVFVYANDLWIVDREGGLASPLASPPGSERFPRFSADGKTIAFEGNYEGGRDLYTIPVAGGIPHRVTHHPTGETLCDWTPDGDLLFFSAGLSGLGRMPKLYTVAPEGGLPEALPVPYGAVGAISGDGRWLAYTPHTRDARTWKRYRGGMATDIWLFDLESHESRLATDWEGTDSQPMWHDGDLYYLSDGGPEHRLNIWRFEPKTGARTQVTKFDEYDVKWPAMGPGKRDRGEIIFQNGSGLFVLDLARGRVREVEVTIPGARPRLAPQRVDARSFITEAGISATGKRAVASARGDIWTAPAEHGSPRNLTRTAGVHERSPAWSPDGKWIAYFADATGEYELYVMRSDGKKEPEQLTEGNATFFQGLAWSPDSKHLVWTDKAGSIWHYSFESDETAVIDTDPWGNAPTPSWSHDSRWLVYARSRDESPVTNVRLHDLESGESHDVTAGMFADQSPVFDRKGDYIYFASSRSFSPRYSDLDTTWIYDRSQVLVAVPLRADVKSPWLLESDEETWKDEEPAEEESADDAEGEDEGEDEGDSDDEADEDADEDAGDDDAADESAAPGHPIHGSWEGSLTGLASMGMPMDVLEFVMTLVVADDGSITGSMTVMGESDDFDEITFDEGSGTFTATSTDEDMGMTSVMKGTLVDGRLSGTWTVSGPMSGAGTWEATKLADGEEGEAGEAAAEKPAERVEIDLEGFEERAFQLPVGRGNFGTLAVNDRNQLLYASMSESGPAIKLYDLKDKEGGEKTVAAGAFGFDISGDGKKILIPRGNSAQIQGASAGSSGKPIVMDGAIASIDPRTEWAQILREAWRLHRDFFYVENMHGVDWEGVYERYAAMVPDCASREDLSFVIGEMIAELNVGHAYYFGGDGDSEPFTNVGLLGVDWELNDGAYRIASVVGGGPWDLDARGPLAPQGLDVGEGDYILAVNGIPIDPAKDPWAAFIGTAGREITLTVSEKPEIDDDARDVVVKPIGSEGTLRYRAWIEHNRRYVADRTDGRVGYIYVPNTGVDGQTDLVRQFFGQFDKEALIIDERWNGGGQIPTRFIELLNRPVTNSWARRDGRDWVWPPDAHQGPKCMLINGLAGSGGDMFPYLFRQAGLGKLIGTRTWGGLVGISGNPGLIDGGYTAVPTFGFYETNDTWGIEGHGVDPDIEVIDDPALMVEGGDPQLDAAIELMLEEMTQNPFRRPKRPAAPDRSGMGISDTDK